MKISNKLNVIIDPGKWLNKMLVPIEEKADIILVTHRHQDHLGNAFEISKRNNAVIIAGEDVINAVTRAGASGELTKIIKPGEETSYKRVKIKGHKLTHGPKFFPFTRHLLGFTIFLGKKSFTHLGDAASLEDMQEIKCDVLFVPVGGFFTFNPNRAAEAISIIKPKIAFPIHAKTSKAKDFLGLVKKKGLETNVIVLEPGASVTV